MCYRKITHAGDTLKHLISIVMTLFCQTKHIVGFIIERIYRNCKKTAGFGQSLLRFHDFLGVDIRCHVPCVTFSTNVLWSESCHFNAFTKTMHNLKSSDIWIINFGSLQDHQGLNWTCGILRFQCKTLHCAITWSACTTLMYMFLLTWLRMLTCTCYLIACMVITQSNPLDLCTAEEHCNHFNQSSQMLLAYPRIRLQSSPLASVYSIMLLISYPKESYQ